MKSVLLLFALVSPSAFASGSEAVFGKGPTCEEAIKNGEQRCYDLGYSIADFSPALPGTDPMGCGEDHEDPKTKDGYVLVPELVTKEI